MLSGIQIKTAKGLPMLQCKTGMLLEGVGLEGNYHTGGPRQVSLMAFEAHKSVESLKGAGLCLEKYAANLLTTGLDYSALKPGDRIAVGEALLMLSEVGKHCFVECVLFQQKSTCPLTTMSAFAEVVRSGRIVIGDVVELVD